MPGIAIVELVKEALHTFNLIYEDQPVAQRRASLMMFWNLVKPLVMLRLTPEQKQQIEAIEADLRAKTTK